MKRIHAIAIIAGLFVAGSFNADAASLRDDVVSSAVQDSVNNIKSSIHASDADVAPMRASLDQMYGAIYDRFAKQCGGEFITSYQTASAAGNVKVMENLAGSKINDIAAVSMSLQMQGNPQYVAEMAGAVATSACFQYNVVGK